MGRDELIRRLWLTLETQSAVLTSERRIGKTSVLRKMEAEPPPGWAAFYMVVEGVRSPMEFIGRLVDTVSPFLSRKKRVLASLERVYGEVAGQELKDWSLPKLRKHWKRLLRGVIDDIATNFDDRVVFMWDELPLMIANIKDDMGPTPAMELLDELRDHRHNDTKGRVRMIFAGSVGLHLVLRELKNAGYRNKPTNEMRSFPVGGLAERDGTVLAHRGLLALLDAREIILGEETSSEDLAREIARVTDGLPFYIDHVVMRISELAQPATIEHVQRAVDALIMDPNDPAYFRHYDERIDTYYDFYPLAQQMATAVLCALSRSAAGLSEAQLEELLAAQVEVSDRREFQQLLESLAADHYITRQRVGGERRYRFQYDLIRRWWLANRA